MAKTIKTTPIIHNGDNFVTCRESTIDMFISHRLLGIGRGYPSEADLRNSTFSPNYFLRRENLVKNRAFVLHA